MWILVAILVSAWLLGMLSSYTMGGLIHLLLLVALLVFLARLFLRRRP